MIKQSENLPEKLGDDYGRIVHGAFMWELRLWQALRQTESGQHTLRVSVRDGCVRDVVHSVEDHI